MKREDILKVYEAGPNAVVDLVEELIRGFTAIIAQQAIEIRELKERVKVLENQLSKNSRNSGKPPSSDGYKKPNPKSLRVKGEQSPGGQVGHKGHTLKFSSNPDHITINRATTCSCGQHLDQEPVLRHEKRQVHDLPPTRIEVTEHQAEVKCCPSCGSIVKAVFASGVTAPVQYGPKLRATMIYLSQYQLLPYKRVSELMEDLFQHKLSEGSLVNANLFLHQQLEPVEREIIKQITNAAVAHFDETGMRVQGKTQWCHVASTDKLTHYYVHKKRGKDAMEVAGVLPSFKGTAVHDAWASYFNYDQCHHALCNAHILRELIFVLEEENQLWAKQMIDLLLEAKTAVAKSGSQDAKVVSDFDRRYEDILEIGYLEDTKLNPQVAQPCGKRGKPKQSKPKNLLDRLRDRRREVLTFLYDPNVPFDNNQAERDVRMVKVQQKISGTFRSEQGAKIFCRIRGYISTAKKHACAIIDVIEDALGGKSFLSPEQI